MILYMVMDVTNKLNGHQTLNQERYMLTLWEKTPLLSKSSHFGFLLVAHSFSAFCNLHLKLFVDLQSTMDCGSKLYGWTNLKIDRSTIFKDGLIKGS